MKNFFRLFGIIAIVAVIGFGFVACDDGGGTTGKTDPSVTWPTGLTATVGQTLSQINLPGNVGTPGVFTWTNPTAQVGQAGQQTHSITFTPQDTATYNTLQNNVTVTVTVGGTLSLDGVWRQGTNPTNYSIITINGSTGAFTQIADYGTGTLMQDAINKGYISIGSQMYWNLTKTSTGNLTWTGQKLMLTYNTSSPNVSTGTSSDPVTITLSADGQTFTDGNLTWTRITTYSLDGVWRQGTNPTNYSIITINGSTGVFTQIADYGTGTLMQDAINKGYIGIGSQMYWNLTKTSTGNLTWTGQKLMLTYNTSSPNVSTGTSSDPVTITLSADGQTFSDGNLTWTRQ